MSIRSKFTYDELYPRKGKDIKPVTLNKINDLVSEKKSAFVHVHKANNVSKSGAKTRTSPHDMKALKGLMQYLARDDMKLTNPRGKEFGSDKIDNELVRWPYIPADNGTQREAIHIVMSAHKGDDRDKVKDGITSIVNELFPENRYVIAHHNNTERQHAHVVVKSLEIGGLKRLHPGRPLIVETNERLNQAFIDRGLGYTTMTKRDRLSDRHYIKETAYNYLKEKNHELLHEILKSGSKSSINERSHGYYFLAEKLSELGAEEKQLGAKLKEFTDSRQVLMKREYSRDTVSEKIKEPVKVKEVEAEKIDHYERFMSLARG